MHKKQGWTDLKTLLNVEPLGNSGSYRTMGQLKSQDICNWVFEVGESERECLQQYKVEKYFPFNTQCQRLTK